MLVPPNKGGRTVVQKDVGYICMVEVPEPVLPASVTTVYSYNWPPRRSRVRKDTCEKCPMFEHGEG